MVDNLLLALLLTFTELLKIAEVTGIPPIKPKNKLPIPWAINSRLAGDFLPFLSILSTASKFNNVSKEVTKAKLTAARYKSGLEISKLGKVKNKQFE